MKKIVSYFIYAAVFASVSCGGKQEDDVKKTEPLLYVPDDLEVTVWAESPMFFNPTNMDVDLRGRIWLTEAVNYRDFRNDSTKHLFHKEGDRVMILEDRDSDGSADTSIVYVQDKELRSPLGIVVTGNKVIVSCSPSVIVYTDTNGDDHPDHKQVFLTGFGGRDHDHGLHSGIAGPDGKLYFNTGNAGPHIVTDKSGKTLRSGSVYTYNSPYFKKNKPAMKSDDGRIWTGGLVFRINPDGTGLEVVAHNFRNSYEVMIDSYGDFWQNDNDDEKAACRTSFLLEGGNAGYFARTGERTWQADRRFRQPLEQAHWHQQDPGVLPAGDIYGSGSPTGITRIEGDELGIAYRGMLLSADAGRNIIFGYMPEKDGAGFSLTHRRNLIASVNTDDKNYTWNKVDEQNTRKWFRPSDVTIGTDGAVYVADWYDPIVGGHQMNDLKGFGRIYRVSPKNKVLKTPLPDTTSVDGLVNMLTSPAVHTRNFASEKLKSIPLKNRQDAFMALKKKLSDNNPFYRARMLWVLASFGADGIAEVEKSLTDKDPQIRITAYRSLNLYQPENLLKRSALLATDADAAVRRTVAIAIRHHPVPAIREIIINLVKKYDGTDRWYLNAIGIALEGKTAEIYPSLLSEFGNPDPLQWSKGFNKLVWELHPTAAVNSLLTIIRSSKDEENRQLAFTALAFISTNEAAMAMKTLLVNEDKNIVAMAQYWLQFRKTNDWAGYLGDYKTPADQLPEPHPELLALRKKIADSSETTGVKINAATELAKTRLGILHLVHLAAVKRLPDTVKAAIANKVMMEDDRYIKSLASHFFKAKDTSKFDFDKITGLQPDTTRGKKLVMNNCMLCHKVGNTGGETGPILTSIRDKYDQLALLDAIVHPDNGIAFGTETFLITTKEGGIIYGILLSNGAVVTALDVYGRQYMISDADILSKQSLKNSLMPSPEYLKLSHQDLADISGFLMQLKTK